MHPALILIPALALVLGPRLWVGRVLKRHDGEEWVGRVSARDLARRLLDAHGLQAVPVEVTDLGEHYDPEARVVRLTRSRIDRRSLTALTTAAHEVAHALQHAEGYGPFLWRLRLVRLGQVAGEVGGVLLLAVPIAALVARDPLPPVLVGAAALGVLGSGVVAQLAALPAELDASFARALPMLREGIVDAEHIPDAHQILLACSLTYVAASLVAILYLWPWLGHPPGVGLQAEPVSAARPTRAAGGISGTTAGSRRRVRRLPPDAERLIRGLGRPLVRGWLRLCEGT